MPASGRARTGEAVAEMLQVLQGGEQAGEAVRAGWGTLFQLNLPLGKHHSLGDQVSRGAHERNKHP